MSSSASTHNQLDAVVLGAAALDMLAWVDRLPEKDGIVSAYRVQMEPGGSGANVAVALARLGFKTGFVGRLSHDANGLRLKQAFAEESVDISACRPVEDMPSALCFIAIDRAGDRSKVTLGGAGPSESIDELDPQYLSGTRVIYLTDVSPAIVHAVADFAATQGSCLVFSPGGLICARGLPYLLDLLPKPDVWLLSRSEALALLPGSAPQDSPSALCRQGARQVVITLGERGAAYASHERAVLSPALPVDRVVDTTGAGDAFAGGMLGGILLGKGVEASLRLGTAAASLKIRHAGARRGLPSMVQLQQLLAESSPQ